MRGHLVEMVRLSRINDDAKGAHLFTDEKEADVRLAPDAGAHLSSRLQLLREVDGTTSVLRHARVEERVPERAHVRLSFKPSSRSLDLLRRVVQGEGHVVGRHARSLLRFDVAGEQLDAAGIVRLSQRPPIFAIDIRCLQELLVGS